MTFKKIEKSFWKGLVTPALIVSLLFQGCKVQIYSGDCHKLSQKSKFRDCMHKKFPPGSSYRELEELLVQQGFNKIVDEPKGDTFDFVFVWEYPISLKNNSIVVSGEYNKQLRVVELRRP